MKIAKIITLVLLMFGAHGTGLSQGRPESIGKDLTYENHNQTDYGPLRITKLSGVAEDPQRVPIPGAFVLLFSEGNHKLIAHSQTNQKGAFGINGVQAGKYRLVVKYPGFCAANVPIDFKPKSRRKGNLIVFMRLAGLDECSYGALR